MSNGSSSRLHVDTSTTTGASLSCRNPSGSLGPVDAVGHAEVHHNHGWSQSRYQSYRLLAAARFADHRKNLALFEDIDEGTTEHNIVVGYEDRDRNVGYRAIMS